MSKKLYIGNIAFGASEEDLKELFQQAGEVESVKIITDRDSRRSRGFGFIEMAHEADAGKAKEMFNGYALQNRNLIVNDARPQRERGYKDNFRKPRGRFQSY